MLSAKEKLIRKVKKLMAMAADASSPNEAAIAAGRARKLMDEHQISLEDLQERSSFSQRGCADARRFTPHWENMICVAVAKFNDCLSTLEWKKSSENGCYYQLTFKGFDEDVRLAEYMFFYILEYGKRQCSKYMKEKGFKRYNARLGTSFKDAYAKELTAKINLLIKERQVESESTGTGLMVVKNQLVEQHFGVAKYKSASRNRGMDIDDIEAQMRGQQAGQDTPIHVGLETEERKRIK